MPDWTRTPVFQAAMTMPCRYCHAPAGEPCTNRSEQRPIEHFPAHLDRIKDTNGGRP